MSICKSVVVTYDGSDTSEKKVLVIDIHQKSAMFQTFLKWSSPKITVTICRSLRGRSCIPLIYVLIVLSLADNRCTICLLIFLRQISLFKTALVF